MTKPTQEQAQRMYKAACRLMKSSALVPILMPGAKPEGIEFRLAWDGLKDILQAIDDSDKECKRCSNWFTPRHDNDDLCEHCTNLATDSKSEQARYAVRRDLRPTSDAAYIVDMHNYSKQISWHTTEAEAQAAADKLNGVGDD